MDSRPQQKIIDSYLGKKYSMLTVLSFSHYEKTDTKSKYYFNCLCDCGNECVRMIQYITKGATKSCGCLTKTINITHGMSKTRLHSTWGKMLDRCYKDYNKETAKHYKDRGIKVCIEWHDFVNFRDWAMANGYKDNLTIDRINNDGDYEPGNCRWATYKQQNSNYRRNIWIEYKGQRLIVKDWAEKLGFSSSLIYARLKRGWSPYQALSTPIIEPGYTLDDVLYK